MLPSGRMPPYSHWKTVNSCSWNSCFNTGSKMRAKRFGIVTGISQSYQADCGGWPTILRRSSQGLGRILALHMKGITTNPPYSTIAQLDIAQAKPLLILGVQLDSKML